jgi:hypothetical protein
MYGIVLPGSKIYFPAYYPDGTMRAVWLAGQSSVDRPSHCHPAQFITPDAQLPDLVPEMAEEEPLRVWCKMGCPGRLLSCREQSTALPWDEIALCSLRGRMKSALGCCSLQTEAGGHQPLPQGFCRVPPAWKLSGSVRSSLPTVTAPCKKEVTPGGDPLKAVCVCMRAYATL